MTATVRKTISLPPDLARDAEETARAEGKTLSAVVRDALRQTRATACVKSSAPCRTTGVVRRKNGRS